MSMHGSNTATSLPVSDAPASATSSYWAPVAHGCAQVHAASRSTAGACTSRPSATRPSPGRCVRALRQHRHGQIRGDSMDATDHVAQWPPAAGLAHCGGCWLGPCSVGVGASFGMMVDA
eukprot:365616-Chlamydomonas_euryale.AAC.1